MSESPKAGKNIKATIKRKKNYVSSSSSQGESDEGKMKIQIKKNEEKEIENLKLNLFASKEVRSEKNKENPDEYSDEKLKQDNYENKKAEIENEDQTKILNQMHNVIKDDEIIKNNKNNNNEKESPSSKENKDYKQNENNLKIKETIFKNAKDLESEEDLINKNSFYKAPKTTNIKSNERDFEKGFDVKNQNDNRERLMRNSDVVDLNQKGFINENHSNRNDKNIDFPYFSRGNDHSNNNNNFRFNNNNRGRGRGNRGGRNFDREFNGDFPRNDNFNNRYNNTENNFNRGRRIHIDDYKFYTENEKIIKKMKEFYEYMDENDIIKHLKIFIQNGSITIFEFLNEFHRENTITKHEKFSNSDNKKNFSPKINIFEQDKDSLDSNTKFMIESYKTIPQQNSEPLIFPSEFYDRDEEKRRKIYKDENGFFNYIPIKCKEHILVDSNDYCKYSHNDNEINYHSLVYKTQFCSKNCQFGETCKNAHDAKELRKIYELNQKEGFTKFILKIEKYLKKKNLLKDYLEYVEVPMSFSLDTFKVHRCKFKNCNTDSHLCYFFHNEYERRRYPKLFNLLNRECEDYFINANDTKTRECPEGDFCKYFHNKHEMVYHENNFRRQIKCQRPVNKLTGRCIYFDTCYGIHKTNEDSDNEIGKLLNKCKYLNEKVSKLSKLNSELNEKCSILKDENEEFHKVLACRHCGDGFVNFEIILTCACQHLICIKCMELSLKKNKKCCIICNEKIEKNSLIRIPLNPDMSNEQTKNNDKKEKNKNRNKTNNQSDSE